MPDDPTGTHFLPPSYKVQEGDTVLPVQHNPPLEDLSQAASNRLHKDGRTAWTGNQNANGYKVTGLAAGTAANDAATVSQSVPQVGDFKDTVRTLDSNWLRRNGAAYSSATYSDLAAFFPAIPAGLLWDDYEPEGIEVFTGLTRLSNSELAVVGANYFQKSADWLTMTDRAQYRSGPTQAYTFTEYGDGVYVVCSSGGAPGPTAASGSYVSIDGGESFLQTGYPNNVPVNGLAWFNDMFIAFCIDDSSVHVSGDGITWTRHSTGWVGTNWAAFARHVIVGGEIFVVNSANDYFIYSDDGTTWTNATNAHICNDIAYVDGWFVTVSNGGVIRRTNNFKTGTWETVSSGTTQDLRSIEASNGVLIAVGNGVTLMSTNLGAGWVFTGTDETRDITRIIQHHNSSNRFVSSVSGELLIGELSESPLFRVPDDNPAYGWIKALP